MTSTSADIALLDATDQAALVRNGEVAATELVEGAIERIERLNPVLDAVVTPMFDQARRGRRGRPLRRVRSRACRTCSRTSSWRSRARRSTRARGSCAATSPPSPRSWCSGCAVPGLVVLGQDQHARVRHGARLRAACCTGPTRNPWDPQPLDQRIERRIGGGGRGADGADGPRQRPRRLDPLPGVGVRAVRAQADPGPQPARARVRRRRQRLGGRARADPLGARQRRAARRHRGPGAGRPVPGAARGPAVRRGGRRRPRSAAHRLHRPRLPDGEPRPPRLRARRSTTRCALCAELGHDLVEADLPGLDEPRRCGDRHGVQRGDGVDRRLLDPATRAASPRRTSSSRSPAPTGTWGAASPPPTTSWPSSDLQKFARGVAGFLGGGSRRLDLWLTPTMSAPPAPIGEIVSTADGAVAGA